MIKRFFNPLERVQVLGDVGQVLLCVNKHGQKAFKAACGAAAGRPGAAPAAGAFPWPPGSTPWASQASPSAVERPSEAWSPGQRS